MTAVPHRLWQLAGALALAHVALVLVSLVLQQGPLFADGTEGIIDRYVEGDLVRTFSGGLVAATAFLVMVPTLVFLGRVLGRRSEGGRWSARTGMLLGVGYVTVIFAVGLPAGAAAMYGAQHGLDVDVAFALNNVRIFSYFLSMMLLGGSTIGFALAALADRTHPRWFGGFGLFAGALLLVSPSLASIGQQDWGELAFTIWFVGVGVLLLRHRDDASTHASEPSPREVAIGHS